MNLDNYAEPITVGELIARLSLLPPDLKVWADTMDGLVGIGDARVDKDYDGTPEVRLIDSETTWIEGRAEERKAAFLGAADA